ncbi:MAG: SMP-30/gluconolactonase/LRE family protein [Actinomycetota bacterium]
MKLTLDLKTQIGECPLWDPRAQLLRFVDIEERALHAYHPESGELCTIRLPEAIGFVALARDRSVVVGLENGVHRLDLEREELELIVAVEEDQPTRINDGRCDPAGRLWFGTLAADMTAGAGSLYRLGSDGLERVVSGATISNGLDWSPDGRTLYYVDTLAPTITAFPFSVESGELGKPRRFASFAPSEQFPPPSGLPDGLCVDASGGVWVAMLGAGELRCYRPDGTLARTVTVPTSLVTSCGFGGASLDVLYATSARHLLTLEQARAQPSAGGLYCARMDVRGQYQRPFHD